MEMVLTNRNPAFARSDILEIIDSGILTTYFQPIFSLKTGKVYGYEALARVKSDRELPVGMLFNKAIQEDVVSILDVACRESAVRNASIAGIRDTGAYLFINICPETLSDPSHREGITDEIIDKWGIPKDKVILEITERRAVCNSSLFHASVSYYKKRGYKIALDDFGAGYGGLGMFLSLEPDIVKIDRSLISFMDSSPVKFTIVDSIVSACNRMGVKVIAEGIEREEELYAIMSIGIELVQGYYFCKALPYLFVGDIVFPNLEAGKKICCVGYNGEFCVIGDISRWIEPITPGTGIMTAFTRFMEDPTLRSLPVVDEGRIVGVLQRNRFLEQCILGKYGYGMHLNATKLVKQVMENPSLVVESKTSIEEVSKKIQLRRFEYLYDDVCVIDHGLYHGMVALHVILDAITEMNLTLAKNANPLSGLPGNESIQREINKRLFRGDHFDVCYLDINNFKPYNDHYGFERGDAVIKSIAYILKEFLFDERISFAGHIGGDDFIFITPPRISELVCEEIIRKFEDMRNLFHDQEDFELGYYVAKNRKNEEEKFPLLSISIGIVGVGARKIDSYAHLASVATEVKKASKMQSASLGGSSYLKDRRER